MALTMALREAGHDPAEYKHIRTFFNIDSQQITRARRQRKRAPAAVSTASSGFSSDSGESSPASCDYYDPLDFLRLRPYYRFLRRSRFYSDPTYVDPVEELVFSSDKGLTDTSSQGACCESDDESSASDEGDSERKESLKKLLEAKRLKQLDKEIKRNLHIMYGGRDILSLERTVRPEKWGVASPLHGCLNPFKCVNYRTHQRFAGDSLVEELPMQTCEDCGFYQPSLSDENTAQVHVMQYLTLGLEGIKKLAVADFKF